MKIFNSKKFDLIKIILFFILLIFVIIMNMYLFKRKNTNIMEPFETNYSLISSMTDTIDVTRPKPLDPGINTVEFIGDPVSGSIDSAKDSTTNINPPNPADQKPTPNVMSIYPGHDPKYDNPFETQRGWNSINKYQPIEEHSFQYSKLTGLSNSSPVYYVNDIGEGFCKFHKTNIAKIEEECNQLDPDTCAVTSCCVLLGGQKCVYGNKNGPKMTSNYTDPSILKRDVYYHMGKCYGNCPDKSKKYNSTVPLVPSNRCAPPSIIDSIQNKPGSKYANPAAPPVPDIMPKKLFDDQQYIFSSPDSVESPLMPNGAPPADIIINK